MVTTLTRAALSAVERAVTKEDVLKLIPQYEIRSILRRHHLNRTIIIGLIGQRGDGKSGSGAGISLVDFMFEGYPCHSNMGIRCDLEIDEETAWKYGLRSGGIAHYESIPLDKEALLKFDERFRKTLIFGDEINMELSDARRSMSNTNIWSSNVAQELRHLEAHLVYSVIDEMFIDVRLRTLTDIFLRCEDTALSEDGLNSRQREGITIKWTPYAMTGYLAGRERSYYLTHKTLAPVHFNFGLLHGIYNDKQLQATMKAKYGVVIKKAGAGEMKATISVDSARADKHFEDWGWLLEKAKILRDKGITTIKPYELWQFLELDKRNVKPTALGSMLPNCGIYRDEERRIYRVGHFRLEDLLSQTHSPRPDISLE